jgi:hypothetical protein
VVPLPLEEVVHEANIWIRACNHNLGRLFEGLDADIFNGDEDFYEYMSNPPAGFLERGPAMARASFRRCISGHRNMFTALMSDGERATLVRPEDEQVKDT